MAKTSKYAVNEICINGKTYVHNPLFRVVGSGSGASNPEDATLKMDWYEDRTGNDTGNVYNYGVGTPDVYGLRASVKFNIQYRGRVSDCYVGGESHNLHYRGSIVYYLDIPQNTVLDIVYDDGDWNIMSLPDIMCIKYNDLCWLVTNGYLIPGMKYRIIDYIPAVRPDPIDGIYYHVDASVTQFDIIVTALSENELSEDAEACLPEQCAASRNYYKSFNVNLGSWKLKYTIDDNPIKYGWATGYVVNNPGTTVYTDGKRFAFGFIGTGGYMGYTSDYRYIRYQNSTPRYLFDFSYDSCYILKAGVGAPNGTSGSKDFTVYGDTVTVYKQYQYIIDGELYYASDDIYRQGLTSQGNVLLISESHYNSTTPAFGIYIEIPIISEYDAISSISWVSTNRGVVYNMIDDKGNEAPWDFKNICIGQINNPTTLGHFFEKQSLNGIFRDESIEGNTIFNNVIKPVKGHVYTETSPWSVYPYKLCSNRCRIVTQNETYNNYYTIHNNIIENCEGVTIMTSGAINESSNNHIKDSYNTTIGGKNNYISNISSGSSAIYGYGNTVLGGAAIKIGSVANPSSYNTVGSSCGAITIGENCFYNSFGAGCSNITLGSTDNYNSFGAGCSNITLGSSCFENTYGNRCEHCYVRTAMSPSATIRNYVENCHWDDGVRVTLYNTMPNSSGNKVQNVHVHRGVSFTTNRFVIVPINAAYEHTVTRALPSTSNSTIVS